MTEELKQAAQRLDDDVRSLSKWLNEEITAPIDRAALARVLHALTQRPAAQTEREAFENAALAKWGPLDFERSPHVPEMYYNQRLDDAWIGFGFAVAWLRASLPAPQQATPEPVGEPYGYVPGEWYEAKDRDDLEAFFRSRLPAIREAARERGYAIGLHGSMRRDLDLIAAPWREGASDKDVLAHAIAMAACGITRDGAYEWEQKPLGRVAASLPCCWPRWFNEAGAGHIDLSVVGLTRPAPGVPEDGSLLDFMEAHRVAVSPEYEGQWCARQYDDEPQAVAESEAATPRDAIRALAAAQAKGGQA